jgi:hypothetical protein
MSGWLSAEGFVLLAVSERSTSVSNFAWAFVYGWSFSQIFALHYRLTETSRNSER